MYPPLRATNAQQALASVHFPATAPGLDANHLLPSPIWMTRIIVWATSSSAGDTATLEPKKGAVPLEQGEIAVTPQTLAEASRTLDAVKLLYESVGTEAAKRVCCRSLPFRGLF